MLSLSWVPAIFRILLVFCIILLMIRKKTSMGTAFLTGSAILGFSFGMTPFALLKSGFSSLIHPKTLSLSVVVILILVLSRSMEETGGMKRLLNKFQGLIRHPGVNLMFFPAIIGLLPMPGGAIFSAPMVKSIGEPREIEAAQLSFINYWFRHIWEYWWPLYPGVLLATALAGLNIWAYVLCLFPLTLVAVAAGWLQVRQAFRRRGVQKGSEERSGTDSDIRKFLFELTPVLICIIAGLGLGVLLSLIPWGKEVNISKETGLIIALIISIGWVWAKSGVTTPDRKKILLSKELLKMFFMVSSILIFQGVMEQCGAVGILSKDLIELKIPLMPITIILPFIVGMVAGITIAFVGATFPIIISLVQAYGETQWILAYLTLGITAGFVGVLLSPLHLCLVLSNGYFKTNLTKVYPYLVYPCGALIFSAMLYFFCLRAFPL